MNTKEILDKLTDDELRHLHDIIGYNTALQNRELLQKTLMKRQKPDYQYTPHMRDIWKLQDHLTKLEEEITQLYIKQNHIDNKLDKQHHKTNYTPWITSNETRIKTLELKLKELQEIDIHGTHARHVHSLRHPNPEYTTITSTPHVGE